jgi:hypothetical protein
MVPEPFPHITVDFGNLGEDDRVFARAERASRPLNEGDEVLAVDGEGGQCLAQVSAVEAGMVYLTPDWDTWRLVEPTVEVVSTATGVTASEFSDVVSGIGHSNGDAIETKEGRSEARPQRRTIRFVPSS